MSIASHLLIEARGRAFLSQAELARRAGIPRSVLNAYERDRRQPGADALARLLAAAGFALELAPPRDGVDAERAGRMLAQVLELAEALPRRTRGVLTFPPPDRPMSVVAAWLVALHKALAGVGVPHAFGGAVALAFCANEARITLDLSLHVFKAATHADEVLTVLPDGVSVDPKKSPTTGSHDLIRVWCENTPVDFRFGAQELHQQVAARVRSVSFAGTTIPILDCSSLAVFKAMRDRAGDWADIESIITARTFDGEFALRWVERLLGADHPATARLAALVG